MSLSDTDRIELDTVRNTAELAMGHVGQPDRYDASCVRGNAAIWGGAAGAVLDQLVELRAACRAALPMPLGVAIAAWEKHAALTDRLAKIVEPHVRALEKKTKAILAGFAANTAKGVRVDAGLLQKLTDKLFQNLPAVLEAETGLAQMRSQLSHFKNAGNMLTALLNRKAELAPPKPKSLKAWAASL